MKARKRKPLTNYEIRVITLLAEGRSNKDIGRYLDRPTTAIELCTRRIYKKLSVINRTQAAVLYTKEIKSGREVTKHE